MNGPLTFEPFDIVGRPRVLAGMFRLPFDQLTPEDRAKLNPVASYSFKVGADHDAWLRGRTDRPVYFEDVTYTTEGTHAA